MRIALVLDVVVGIGLGLLAILLVGVFAVRELRRFRLIVKGVAASATVTRVADTGITINNSPRVEVQMLVRPVDGTATFRASARRTVSRLAMHEWRRGAVLKIRYDPDRRDRVWIVGLADRPRTPDGSG